MTDIVERLDAVIDAFVPEIVKIEQAARDEITRLRAEIAAEKASEAKLREALEWAIESLEYDYAGSDPDCEIPEYVRAALYEKGGE